MEKFGAALRYNGNVPKLIAKARGDLFEKLIALAKENDIIIYEDEDLAALLQALEVGQDIPEDLYRAVAEVLAYCYKTNDEIKNRIDLDINQ
jgi:flagellar biosynthesis protein